MKKILLVNNRSLNQDKFKIQNQLLFDSAKELNCQLDIKTNCDVANMLLKNENFSYDAVMFYDKDIVLAKTLENMKLKVFNSSDAISKCDNKALTTVCLQKNNIPIPKTSIIPLLFYYNFDYLKEYVNNLTNTLGLPIICKEWFGSWGEQVYLLKSNQEIIEIIDQKKGKELLFQEYIKESSGEDIRINVVNGKVVASMKRKSLNGDFRANISNGGIMENYIPTETEKKLAIKAATTLGCDFCGVDILQSNKGPLVCEVNSNAHLLNIYNISKVNVAKDILEYILSQIN